MGLESTGKPKKYVEAGPEWPREELRFTSQTFGATSQKNMLGPKPKKYEWANAEKTSWGKCQQKQVEHLMRNSKGLPLRVVACPCGLYQLCVASCDLKVDLKGRP